MKTHIFYIKFIVSIALIQLLALHAQALADSITLKGSVKSGSGYTMVLLNKDGSSKTKLLGTNGSFSFTGLTAKKLTKSSLQLIDAQGRFFGPVVLGKKGSKVSIFFSGKNPSGSKAINIGKLSLKSGYAIAPTNLNSALYAKPNISANSKGQPRGAGSLGIVSTSNTRLSKDISTRVSIKASSSPGEDTDRDGIINSIDADDNGNGILDAADPEAAGSDAPYVGLHFNFGTTLNANVRSGLSDSAIDSVVSGENIFASTFFISLPQNTTIDGGYLVCGDALNYCRPNTPLGYSGGISESSEAFKGPLNTLLNSSGYPTLEKISMSFGPAIVLSIQPRVGRDAFRAGDMYRVVLTSGGTEVSSRTFSLPPYLISSPAIKEYTTNSTTTVVDYDSVGPSSGTVPGASMGDPLVLGSDGLLTINYWRPQREPLGTETGYQDFGGLNYGILVEQFQATCGGLYTNVSSELIEDSTPLGQSDSPFANQGANLTPLVDQVTDRPASSSNILSFTVDMKTCLSRAGGTPGTYGVVLSAAGSELTGGSNTSSQTIYMTIP